jgi:hypothetical protein
VLYNTELFQSICSVLIVASVIGAALNVIPFFFYDLTETKQKAMVNILRVRAFFEDKEKGVHTPEQKTEAEEIIKQAKEYHTLTPCVITAGHSRAEKKMMRGYNEDIEIAKMVWEEITYFSTELGAREYELASKIVECGIGNFWVMHSGAYELLARCGGNKEAQKRIKDFCRGFDTAQKTLKKHFPNGVVDFDFSLFTELFNEEEELELQINEVIAQIKKAKEDKAPYAALSKKLTALRKQQATIRLTIKKATREANLYTRAVKPYLDAERLVARGKSYRELNIEN